MPELFAQYGSNISYQFVLVFVALIWVRFLALFSILPILAGKPAPMPVRVGLSLVLALFMAPLLWPRDRPPILSEDMMLISALFCKEMIVGLVIGLTASMVFFVFEAAGNMIDNQRGMSIARILIPELGTMGSPISLFLFQLAIVVYFAIGGHRDLLASVVRSFTVLPVFAFPAIAPGWGPLITFLGQGAGEILALSVTIAAPVVIAILLSDIILGIANRVAPQINVWEMSFSLKGYVGILLLYFMMLFIQGALEKNFATHRLDVQSAIDLMRGRATQSDEHSPAIPLHLPSFPWKH